MGIPPLYESSSPSSYAPAPTAPARPVPFPAVPFVDWEEWRATGAPAPMRPVCDSAECPPADEPTDPGRRARRYWSCSGERGGRGQHNSLDRSRSTAALVALSEPVLRNLHDQLHAASRARRRAVLLALSRRAVSTAQHRIAWLVAPVLALRHPKQSFCVLHGGAEGATPRQTTPLRRTRPSVLPLAVRPLAPVRLARKETHVAHGCWLVMVAERLVRRCRLRLCRPHPGDPWGKGGKERRGGGCFEVCGQRLVQREALRRAGWAGDAAGERGGSWRESRAQGEGRRGRTLWAPSCGSRRFRGDPGDDDRAGELAGSGGRSSRRAGWAQRPGEGSRRGASRLQLSKVAAFDFSGARGPRRLLKRVPRLERPLRAVDCRRFETCSFASRGLQFHVS